MALIQTLDSQPRKTFDDEDLSELAASIREVGILSPLLVRDLGNKQWGLIAGERRLRAAQLAGLERVPIRVVTSQNDDAVLALIENVQRVDLNPIEEGLAYRKLREQQGMTQEDIARATGKSRTHVSACMSFADLPYEVSSKLAAGVITKGHARVLVAVPKDTALTLCRRIVAEGLSVAATREAAILAEYERKKLVEVPKSSKRGRRYQDSRAREQQIAQLQEAAATLGEKLDTKVTFRGSSRKGILSIHVSGSEDLQRVLDLLGVDTDATGAR